MTTYIDIRLAVTDGEDLAFDGAPLGTYVMMDLSGPGTQETVHGRFVGMEYVAPEKLTDQQAEVT